MLKCFSLDEFLQLSFHYTFYRLYSCYHVLYIIANTVINMTTILLLILSLSVLLLFDNFYMGTEKAAKLERWDLTSKDPLLL